MAVEAEPAVSQRAAGWRLFGRAVGAGQLPDDLRSYFGELKRSYRLSAAAHADRGVPAVVLELLKISDADATWGDLYALEKACATILPDADVPAHLATARDRFRQIVGDRSYASYLAASSADPAHSASGVEAMRGELLALIDRLNYLYTATPGKERIRNRMSFWLSVVTIAAVLVIAAQLRATLRTHDVTEGSHTLLVAMLAGVLGGFVSVQQRLQSATDVDPLFNRLQMSSGFWNIIIVAPIFGGIFAAVLYAIFAAGAITGTAFPVIYAGPSAVAGHAAPAAINLETFLRAAGPASGADLAKLIVWSFIAGFAERFVPDVLSRLASADSGQTKSQ
jgi:hypothetical protein